jgi:predicted negative regulator of RcsB-dependent stress response
MSLAVKNNLSVLSECRQQLEANAKRASRSNRLGWLMAFVLLLGLGVAGWTYHGSTQIHASDQAQARLRFANRTADYEEELATVKAKYSGEADALWVALSHEQLRVDSAEQRSTAFVGQLATATAERDRAVEVGDRLAHENARLEDDLGRVSQAANIAETVRAVWSGLQLAVGRFPSVEEVYRLREQARTVDYRFEAAQASRKAQFETELASAKGRYEGEVAILTSALDYEREMVSQLEERLQTMADRFVSVSTDRGRLKIEQVRLRAQVEELQDDLKRVQPVAEATTDSIQPADTEQVEVAP